MKRRCLSIFLLKRASRFSRLPPDFIKHHRLKNPRHGRSDGRDTATAWDNHRRRRAAEEPRRASDRRGFTVNQDYGAGSLSPLNNLQRLQAGSWWKSRPFFSGSGFFGSFKCTWPTVLISDSPKSFTSHFRARLAPENLSSSQQQLSCFHWSNIYLKGQPRKQSDGKKKREEKSTLHSEETSLLQKVYFLWTKPIRYHDCEITRRMRTLGYRRQVLNCWWDLHWSELAD